MVIKHQPNSVLFLSSYFIIKPSTFAITMPTDSIIPATNLSMVMELIFKPSSTSSTTADSSFEWQLLTVATAVIDSKLAISIAFIT